MLGGSLSRLGSVKLRCGVNPRPRFFVMSVSRGNCPVPCSSTKCFSIRPLSGKPSFEERLALGLRSLSFRMRTSRRRMTPNRGRVTFGFGSTLGATSTMVAFGRTVGTVMSGVTAFSRLSCEMAFVPGPFFNMDNDKVRYRRSMFGNSGGLFSSPSSRAKLSRSTLCFVKKLLGRTPTVATVAGPVMGSCGHLIPNCRTPICETCNFEGESTLVEIPTTHKGTAHVRCESPSPTYGPCLTFAMVLRTNVSNVIGGVSPNSPMRLSVCDVDRRREVGEKVGILPADL